MWYEKLSLKLQRLTAKTYLIPEWRVKCRQISINVAQKLFWHLYKNCQKCGWFGQNNCTHQALKSCPKCKKIAQSGHTAWYLVNCRDVWKEHYWLGRVIFPSTLFGFCVDRERWYNGSDPTELQEVVVCKYEHCDLLS